MTSRSQVVLPSSSFSKPSNNNGDSLKHEQSGGLCNNKTRSTIFALPVVVMIGILYLYVEMTSFPKESASANLVGNQGLSFASASIAQNHDSNMTNLVNSAALQEGSASAAPKSYDSNAEQEWLDAHKNQLACDFPYQRVDPDCPRFLSLPITPTDVLGNKYLGYVVGLLLAMDMNATYLYRFDAFTSEDNKKHGSYPWVDDILKIGYREVKYDDAISLYQPESVKLANTPWSQVLEQNKNKCNVLFDAEENVCSEGSCYQSNSPRVYERVKSIVRCKILHSDVKPKLRYDPTIYNVAWHIRVGDIWWHFQDGPFFRQMKEQLDVILKGFNYKLHFIIPNPGAGNKPTGGYEVIDEVFQGQTVWHSDLSSEDAILHMMNADLLVTSPSSFCFLATTFSAKPVVLFDTPKDGDHGVYRDSNHYVIDRAGKINEQSLSEIRAHVMYQYALFHDRLIPSGLHLKDSDSYVEDMEGGNLNRPGQVKLDADMDSGSKASRRLLDIRDKDITHMNEDEAIIELDKALRHFLPPV